MACGSFVFFPGLMSLEFLAYSLESNFTLLNETSPSYQLVMRLLPHSCASFILFGKVGGPQLIDINTYCEGCNGHAQASYSTSRMVFPNYYSGRIQST